MACWYIPFRIALSDTIKNPCGTTAVTLEGGVHSLYFYIIERLRNHAIYSVYIAKNKLMISQTQEK